MSLSLLFWILMLLCLVFGFWVGWTTPPAQRNLRAIGGDLILFLLLLVLGWEQFGAPIKG